MNRREFFGAVAALPAAISAEPKPDNHYHKWVNYTFTYTDISTQATVLAIRRCLTKTLRRSPAR